MQSNHSSFDRFCSDRSCQDRGAQGRYSLRSARRFGTAHKSIRPRVGNLAGRAGPWLACHWNWRKKLNNYLNIYRIDKSSEPPAGRDSKIRQMRSRAPKDAADWHKSQLQTHFPPLRCGSAASFLRNRLHTPRHASARSFAIHSFCSENLGRSRQCDGHAIARSLSEPCAFRRPPSAPGRILFRIPNRLTESVPRKHFAIANCRCFYTLRLQDGIAV